MLLILSIKNQMAAMKGAVGTTLHGVRVTHWEFHVSQPFPADVDAYLTANSLHAHFVVR